jgi:hypothetical protein
MGHRTPDKMIGRILPTLFGFAVLLFLLNKHASMPSIGKDGDLKIDFNLAEPSFLKRSRQTLFSTRAAARHADQPDALLLADLARTAPIPSKPYAMVMCSIKRLSPN